MDRKLLVLTLTILAFHLAGLGGCSSLPSEVERSYEEARVDVEYEGNDAGYAVAGVAARHGTDFSWCQLQYREVGTKRKGTFSHAPKRKFFGGSDVYDYIDADEIGTVDVNVLRPGNYEIYNVRAYTNDGFREWTFSLKDEVSIPFSVRPGETTYLGHFQIIGRYRENSIGQTVPAGVVWVASDRLKHDVEIAIRKLTKIEGSNLRHEFDAELYSSIPGFLIADAILHAPELNLGSGVTQ